MPRLRVQGNRVLVTNLAQLSSVPPDRTGEVLTGWSARSRHRLLDKLNTLEFSSVIFSTYTYRHLEDDISVTRCDWNRLLTAARYHGLRGVWVREVQKRGAYHYHVLYLDATLTGVKRLDGLWWRYEGYDAYHQRYGVKHIEVYAASAAVAYVAKYATKSRDTFPGRRWGVFGKVKYAEVKEISVSQDDMNQILEWIGGNARKVEVAGRVSAVHYCGDLGRSTDETVAMLSSRLGIDWRCSDGKLEALPQTS